LLLKIQCKVHKYCIYPSLHVTEERKDVERKAGRDRVNELDRTDREEEMILAMEDGEKRDRAEEMV